MSTGECLDQAVIGKAVDLVSGQGGLASSLRARQLGARLAAMITPDGSARQVAGGLSFPNGMHVMPDAQTLIVAES